MHSDLEGDILLPARYIARSFSLAGAGVHIIQQTLCVFFLLLLCRKTLSCHFCKSCPFSSTKQLWWGPPGDKGMPEAHAFRDIWNTHMYSRIKVRALKNRQYDRWVLNEDRSSKAMNSQTSLPVVTLTQIVLLWSACRELTPPPVYCPCLL